MFPAIPGVPLRAAACPLGKCSVPEPQGLTPEAIDDQRG